ncbi:DMT family transporter [Acinetobacter sp. ANC 5579]|nr:MULTISPECIES: DMT family transporter [Acinetobacter]MCL6236668.1 DMT family transporter [Acinetobacter amyesii]MCL6240281.1 DMT family transporter [Acinetobacter amyesii]OOV82984.1 EamA family transporter [Acinetobacter sp. ANC 5600]QOW50876.1 DMT family transporter [Acinetobacter sp. YH12138]
MMSPQKQGYLYVFITMCIWGGFTLTARLSANWGISAWDITALRFALAFCILMPILIYKKDTAFLWKKEPFILAMLGGVTYCLTAYSAFHYAPAAHAAIFLNGCIPLCTAIAAFLIFKQPIDKHTWISVVIMVSAISLMSYLMYVETGVAFGLGDLLFFISAIWWGIFTVLLKQWRLSAWHAMAGVAVWSAVVFVPIYLLFFPKHWSDPEPLQLIGQVIFHGIFVVIIATLTYVEAIKRLGAFKAGSIVTLAPFIAAILAVPLLNEPLSFAIVCGLVGMGIGAIQPWKWLGRKDSLEQQLEQQKKQSE